MAAPTFSAATYGNVMASVALAATKTAAAFLDLSTAVEGRVTCETTTTTGPPTGLTTFGAYEVNGATTLASGASIGATSLSVASATGLHVGQTIALQVAGGGVGELATISAITGTTLTVGAITNAYSTSDNVYIITETATVTAQPSNAAGAYATNKHYSQTLFLGPSQWVIAALNNDGSVTVTVAVSVNKTPAFV